MHVADVHQESIKVAAIRDQSVRGVQARCVELKGGIDKEMVCIDAQRGVLLLRETQTLCHTIAALGKERSDLLVLPFCLAGVIHGKTEELWFLTRLFHHRHEASNGPAMIQHAKTFDITSVNPSLVRSSTAAQTPAQAKIIARRLSFAL